LAFSSLSAFGWSMSSTVNFAFVYLKWLSMLNMTTLSDLGVCKLSGNVFSKWVGVTIGSSCPQCQGTSFETVEINKKQDEDNF